MEALSSLRPRNILTMLPLVAVVVTGSGFLSLPVGAQSAKAGAATAGVIAGSVTADKGEVRGFRVKARDIAHEISYTVYTNKGKYHIYNLPPSTYQIEVMEAEFESPVQKTDLGAGETKVVDLALKFKPDVRMNGLSTVEPDVKLVEYDELYPPGKARDLLEMNCFECHGRSEGGNVPYQLMPKKTPEGWAAAVESMFNVPGKWPLGKGYNLPNALSAEEKQIVIKYLADLFGPDSQNKELKKDPVVRNEEALAQAIWIQYDQPPVDQSKAPEDLRLRRGTHDVKPSADPRFPGRVWLTGMGSSSVLAVDTLDLNPKTRTKEWFVRETRAAVNPAPNAITEHNGKVYWTEMYGDAIGELDPVTGELKRTLPPTAGNFAHGIAPDSRGQIWYATLATGIVGSLNPETKMITEKRPAEGGSYYAMEVDRNNRLWAPSIRQRMLLMYDIPTGKAEVFRPPANIRRITLDSKQRVWACEYHANAVIMFDPVTKTFSPEYHLPLKYSNPYSVLADPSDTIWLEVRAYHSLVRFNPQSKEFTYFPYPNLRGGTPKLETDANGTIWSGLSGAEPTKFLTGFRVNGNVPARTKSND